MFKPRKHFTYQMTMHFGEERFNPRPKSTALVITYQTDTKFLENYVFGGFGLLEV